MALPKRADGSLNWSRIKRQDPALWHLSDEEMEIMQQCTDFNPDDEELQPRLLPEVGAAEGLRMIAGGDGARQMKMMFDEIQHKHHPDGFDGPGDDY